jgi:predicted transcriptional regulator
MPEWSFLSNHAHVLLCIAHDPSARLRDIAATVGITERAAHRIVTELVDSGYVVRRRNGRRNSYEIHEDLPFRHPLGQSRTIGELLDLLTRGEDEVGRKTGIARKTSGGR